MALPMNSSISASERESRTWRRWLRRYAASTLAIAIAIAAAILVLDPYDTGHFALFPGRGVPRYGQRLSAASVARSPDIDAAIIGNSTVQLLDPRRISAATRLNMVSLAVPGTGPQEQLAIAHWLLRWHPGPQLRAVVLGIDANWCNAEDGFAPSNPFPFWLYGDNRLDYAIHMMRFQSLDHALRKAQLLLGLASPERNFGYHDYDAGRQWTEAGFEAQLASSDLVPWKTSAATRDFAALPLLSGFLRALSPQTAAVLVLPPVYRAALPDPGSPAEGRLEACETALRTLAAERPRTEVIDYLHDAELAGRNENFFDSIHYRSPVARKIETEIATAATALMRISLRLPPGPELRDAPGLAKAN